MSHSHENAQPTTKTTPAIPANHKDKARTFEAAASFIESRGGKGTNGESLEDCQRRALEEWARSDGSLVPAEDIESLELVSNRTSEHEVYYRNSDKRAVKRTWAGVYGQIPAPQSGKLERKLATPCEYLRRMALQIIVFQSDIVLEGACICNKPSLVIGRPAGEPSFVISQEWFQKLLQAPSLKEIAELLEEDGFTPVTTAYFGWFRREDGLVVVDAKPDNFIKTLAGPVPIDLQMKQFTKSEMKAAGLIR